SWTGPIPTSNYTTTPRPRPGAACRRAGLRPCGGGSNVSSSKRRWFGVWSRMPGLQLAHCCIRGCLDQIVRADRFTRLAARAGTMLFGAGSHWKNSGIWPRIEPSRTIRSGHSLWPDLPLSAWSDSCETLHRWTQIAGKVRLATTPLVNHWWNVTLHVNSRGLVAPANSYAGGAFDIAFDFVDHRLRIATS